MSGKPSKDTLHEKIFPNFGTYKNPKEEYTVENITGHSIKTKHVAVYKLELEKIYKEITIVVNEIYKTKTQKSEELLSHIDSLKNVDDELTDIFTEIIDFIQKAYEKTDAKTEESVRKSVTAIDMFNQSMYKLQLKLIFYECTTIQKITQDMDPNIIKKIGRLFELLNKKIEQFNNIMDVKAKICAEDETKGKETQQEQSKK